MDHAAPKVPSAANRLGLRYDDEADRLGSPAVAITDVHTHLRDAAAVEIFADVATMFGVQRVWSMTPLEQIDEVRSVLGDRVRFIAQPEFGAADALHAMGDGFLDRIASFHEAGARIVKFWTAPRARDIATDAVRPDLMNLDGPVRLQQMQLACDLGMGIMTHVGDPDTWFTTRYSDASRYGTKADQYIALEQALDRFDTPWIAAHMGGWPERLDILHGLLERHPNLHLDTSATKWMVRELSRYEDGQLADFLQQWQGRILFGSDIVAQGGHLQTGEGEGGRAGQSASPQEAAELYASRYFALRTLFESEHVGESPIADPDLTLVNPDRFGPMDAPLLRGHALPAATLKSVYRDAADAWLARVSSASSRHASN